MPDTDRPQLKIRERVDGTVVGEYELDEIDVPLADTARPTQQRRSGVRQADAESSASRPARRKSSSAPKTPAATPVYKNDPYIWGIYLALLVFAVVELYSASSSEVTAGNIYGPLIRHGKFLLLGLLIAIGLQRVHYAVLKPIAFPIAVISLLLLLYSTFFGATINGAQRAIRFAGFTIQPPEIVKLTVIIWLAKILGTSQEGRGVKIGAVWKVSAIVLTFSAILWKNGLTNTVLLMGVSICMMLIGGIQMRRLMYVGVIYLAFGGVLYLVKYTGSEADEFNKTSAVEQTSEKASDRSETHKSRFAQYLEGNQPDDEITDINHQPMMAKFAQANGGLIGHGPGKSRETARLPLAFSDYIYSIIIEDLGLVGGLALLTLYLLLLGRAGRVAFKCRRAFPAFLIMGCAVLIVFQALVHMAIVSGVAPVSGQPLPFISKGGTSVLVMSAAIGIMLSVSRYAVRSDGDKNERRAEDAQLSPELQTANASTL